MAKFTVDNSGERFGDKVSIADLAANSSWLAIDSHDLGIYLVQMLMEIDWKFEIESYEYEICTGYKATFKDGSILHIGAWKDADDSFWYSQRGEERAKEIYAEWDR